MPVYKCFLKCILYLHMWSGISQSVAGIVYNNSVPIPDVNIRLKNSHTSTKSNANGKFALEAKIGNWLVFSHIGMHAKEVQIENLDSLKIHLDTRVNRLKEVEVKSSKRAFVKTESIQSRLGTINSKKVGYTAHFFSGEDIKSYSSVGIAEALVGKVPNYTLTARGVTLRSSKNKLALWEIDGMLFDGLPPFIAPDSIESVVVIPSTAGIVMYGKRARGGLIIVNTNRFQTTNNPTTQLIPLKRLKAN